MQLMRINPSTSLGLNIHTTESFTKYAAQIFKTYEESSSRQRLHRQRRAGKNVFCKMCIDFTSSLQTGVGGRSFKFVGEEYQIGTSYQGCVEKYNVEKREMESNHLFPLIIRMLGRISSGEEAGIFYQKREEGTGH